MSSSLYFKGKIRGENKYVTIFAFPGSSNIYEIFKDNLTIPFHSTTNSVGMIFREKDIDYLIDEINIENNKYLNKITEYEKHANGNLDIINEIVELKEIVNDNNIVKEFCFILYNLLEQTEFINGFENIYLILE